MLVLVVVVLGHGVGGGGLVVVGGVGGVSGDVGDGSILDVDVVGVGGPVVVVVAIADVADRDDICDTVVLVLALGGTLFLVEGAGQRSTCGSLFPFCFPLFLTTIASCAFTISTPLVIPFSTDCGASGSVFVLFSLRVFFRYRSPFEAPSRK